MFSQMVRSQAGTSVPQLLKEPRSGVKLGHDGLSSGFLALSPSVEVKVRRMGC
jgi:hypothetical protein